MHRRHTFLSVFFPVFYIFACLTLVGVIVYGIVYLNNLSPMWLAMLLLSALLIGSDAGLLCFQDWGRRMHLVLSLILTVIMVPAILKFMISLYPCTGNCADLPVSPGEFVFLAWAGLLLLMQIGSLVYFNLPKVKHMFLEQEGDFPEPQQSDPLPPGI